MKIKNYFSLFKRKSFMIVMKIALLVWLWLIFQNLLSMEQSIAVEFVHGEHSHHVHQTNYYENSILSAIHNTINMHWFLMLIAMMLPLLFLSVEDVHKKNFKRKRKLSLILFFIGYMFFWTLIGILLSILTHYLNELLNNQIILACLIIVVLVLWQITPYKKISLNRCHLPANINPFGLQSGIDNFKFGIKKAWYCVGACWPFMWLCIAWMEPMMYIMPLFTLFLLVEQIQPKRREIWGFQYF
ncbi:DUF2182 domain-containing protein [Acinetobacter guillouiae]|uniref:DUF2182 domain-containing protein n=1 Tax=Acinetobacter guillouiae TaxID=106649 RepID=UPI0021D3A479|nr:DUF2182 domain-containing protein [Acinetobacter guillouiae]MCU4491373.1 DUF2182 domain-containing protein [Acinetobacter guillouiae]